MAYPESQPFAGDVTVELYAYYNKRNHPDLDNVIKILDGLNGAAWIDDKQVKTIHARLVVDKGETERLDVEIQSMDDGE